MARSKNTAGIGHNADPLSDEEVAALEAYYAHKIRAQRRKADEAKALYDTEREEVNGLFAKVKGDLKTSRKEFEDLLAKQDMSEVEFQHYWAKLSARYARNGLPVGAQPDLFPAVDTVDDQAVAFADGRRGGLAGTDPTPPSYVSPIMHPKWMEGWHDGQKELYLKLDKAGAIIAAREAAKPVLQADEPEEEEDPSDPEVIRAKAKRLMNDGWGEPSADEAEFEAA